MKDIEVRPKQRRGLRSAGGAWSARGYVPRGFERLEAREMLRAVELSWADTSQLTLSFVQDGTLVAGEPSDLHQRFGALASRSEWQSAVLQAFQTWAEQTGSNVGVVPELQPLPLGTPGPRTGDARFGDIRIAARPLADSVMAIAVAHDTIVSGTWGGDVIFNSNANFRDVADIYSVALHEAGHVFGLEHSDDPNSPMYTHGVSDKLLPTEADIADVQRLHGLRNPDQHEGEYGNNTSRTATPIELRLSPDADVTAASHLVYGDITTSSDVDVFSFSMPLKASGPVRVRLQTRRISLLAPLLRVTDVEGVELAQTESRRVGGATVDVLIDDAAPGATYFIEIAALPGSRFHTGGYSLITTFEGELDIPTQDVDLADLVTARDRDFTQQQLQSFVADPDRLIDANENLVDSIITAVNLPPDSGFELYTRYEALGTITSAQDVDYFFFDAAPVEGRNQPYLNLTVRSLNAGRLIPAVSILDRLGNNINGKVLVNGAGEIVLQAPVISGQKYFIRVRANPQSGLFDRGNYRVTLSFVETPIETVTFAAGELNVPSMDGSPVDPPSADAPDVIIEADRDKQVRARAYHLYVATPQLFHLILTAGPWDASEAVGVLATMVDEMGQVVYSIAALPGQTRTQNSLLLMPGSYALRFDGISLNGQATDGLRFRLEGLAISDPFAVDPNDPTADPFFDCPGEDPIFCYPGGIISEDPFLWDEFLDSLPYIPDLEIEELVAALLGDWWSWYWQYYGNYTPPLAIGESYAVSQDSPLVVGPAEGVLSNDVFDPTAIASALLIEDVMSGTLQLAADGSFTYTPLAGFVGAVSFQYEAFDFQQASAPATVTIAVGDISHIPGDMNDDAQVDAEDIDLLCHAIRFDETDSVFDLNLDGQINEDDRLMLLDEILQASIGDANLDGLFNSDDLIDVFASNQYEDPYLNNSGWATGDWDCDGEFTTDDMIAALSAGSYVALAIAAPQTASSSTTHRDWTDAAVAMWASNDDQRARRFGNERQRFGRRGS